MAKIRNQKNQGRYTNKARILILFYTLFSDMCPNLANEVFLSLYPTYVTKLKTKEKWKPSVKELANPWKSSEGQRQPQQRK
jgi:hypothetical protein